MENNFIGDPILVNNSLKAWMIFISPIPLMRSYTSHNMEHDVTFSTILIIFTKTGN